MLSQPTMLVATRGADTLGGVPAPGYRLLRLPTAGTITGKLILVPKPPLPSSYPSEARQESRAGGLGPAAHRDSYEVTVVTRTTLHIRVGARRFAYDLDRADVASVRKCLTY